MVFYKYITASLLSLIILSSTIGFNIIERICDTCKTEESFIIIDNNQSKHASCKAENSCCASEKSCCAHTEHEKKANNDNGCCSTKDTFIKIETPVTLSQNIHINLDFILNFVEIQTYFYFPEIINENNEKYTAKIEIPPDNKQILNCIFRI